MSATPAHAARSAPVALLLVAARVRMAVNGALRSGTERRASTLLLTVGAAAFALLGHRLADAALTVSDPAPGGLEPGLAGLAAMLAGFAAVTSVTFAVGALFLADDVEMLLAAPVRPRAVIAAKLVVQLLTGALVVGTLATAPALAYLGRHGAVGALPWIGVAFGAMAAIPLAVGTALTVALVRVLPARRVRDAGGVAVAVGALALGAVTVVAGQPGDGGGAVNSVGPAPAAPGLADAAWLPTGWAARACAAAVRGDMAAAAGWTALLAATALVLIVVLCAALERVYVGAVQRTLGAAAPARRARGRGSRRRGRARPWLVIAWKDLVELRRSPGQLVQLCLPLVLVGLFVASPSVSSARQDALPAWFPTLLSAWFASLFAASALGLRGVGGEGARMWLLRAAPLGARSILAAKWLAAAAVAGVLGLTLCVEGLARLRTGPLAAAGVGCRLLVVTAGLVALAVGVGAVRPRLDWSDPRRAVGVGTAVVYLVAGAAYLGVAGTVTALPYADGPPPAMAVAASVLGLCALAGATATIALRLGAARLRRLEL